MLFNAIVALGSNQDNPVEQLNTALSNISNLPHTTIIKKSKFYHTKPYGYLDQEDFVNAVIKIKTQLNCHSLLEELQNIENLQGRMREIKWGPRTLDLDIIAYEQLVINTPYLTIPHPDLANRLFVLEPLHEIEPNWILPCNNTVKNLLYKLKQTSKAS